MRRRALALALPLFLSALLLQGCFALELLDESEKEMDALTQGTAAAAEPERGAEPPAAAKRPDPSKAWWGRARTLAPGDADASIVRCELRGATQFARRSDCLARGGRPAPRG